MKEWLELAVVVSFAVTSVIAVVGYVYLFSFRLALRGPDQRHKMSSIYILLFSKYERKMDNSARVALLERFAASYQLLGLSLDQHLLEEISAIINGLNGQSEAERRQAEREFYPVIQRLKRELRQQLFAPENSV